LIDLNTKHHQIVAMKMIDALELKIPPPLLILFFATAMYALDMLLPNSQASFHIAFAIIPLIIGASFALSGIYSFRKVKTTVHPSKPERASSLVTSGVYKITRNPMYLGLFCVLMGWAIILGNVYTFIAPFIFAFYISRFQIMPEERALEGVFGDAFTAYKQKVRRWI